MRLALVVFAAVMLGQTIGYLIRVASRAGEYTATLRAGQQAQQVQRAWVPETTGSRWKDEHGADEEQGQKDEGIAGQKNGSDDQEVDGSEGEEDGSDSQEEGGSEGEEEAEADTPLPTMLATSDAEEAWEGSSDGEEILAPGSTAGGNGAEEATGEAARDSIAVTPTSLRQTPPLTVAGTDPTPSPAQAGTVLPPTLDVSSPGGRHRVRCYEAYDLWEAPWPKSGGFCHVQGVRLAMRRGSSTEKQADEQVFASDGTDERETWVYTVPPAIADALDRAPLEVFPQPNMVRDGTRQTFDRGDMLFQAATADEDDDDGSSACASPGGGGRRPVVFLTPAKSTNIQHYANPAFQALSYQRHAEEAFGLPRLTHVIDLNIGHYALPDGGGPWFRHVSGSLFPAMGVDVLPNTLHASAEVMQRVLEGSSDGCFDAVVGSIGGGTYTPPTWLLDRDDALVVRHLLISGPDAVRDQKLTERSEHVDIDALVAPLARDVHSMRLVVVDRPDRGFADNSAVLQCLAGGGGGEANDTMPEPSSSVDVSEVDPGWEISATRLVEDLVALSPADQIAAFADADLLVTTHGAQVAHGTYMAPCAAVVEVHPYLYAPPGYASRMPRSGKVYANLYKNSPIGTPDEVTSSVPDRSFPTTVPKSRMARRNPGNITVDCDTLRAAIASVSHRRAACLAAYAPEGAATEFTAERVPDLPAYMAAHMHYHSSPAAYDWSESAPIVDFWSKRYAIPWLPARRITEEERRVAARLDAWQQAHHCDAVGILDSLHEMLWEGSGFEAVGPWDMANASTVARPAWSHAVRLTFPGTLPSSLNHLIAHKVRSTMAKAVSCDDSEASRRYLRGSINRDAWAEEHGGPGMFPLLQQQQQQQQQQQE